MAEWWNENAECQNSDLESEGRPPQSHKMKARERFGGMENQSKRSSVYWLQVLEGTGEIDKKIIKEIIREIARR